MSLSLGVTDGDLQLSLQVVTRAADSYDSNGNGVRGADNEAINIEADIQPVSTKLLQDLPEGVREEAEFTLWTSYDLKIDHVIVYKGLRYRVIKTWERREDDFTRAVIGLLKDDR